MEYTEEEKKAIERCNELKKDCHKEWIGISNQVAIDIVLNLLEKQQEEIAEKKESIIEMAKVIQELCNKYVNESFSKEDIRELKEEAEKVTETSYGRIKYQEGKIQAYKELLGE